VTRYLGGDSTGVSFSISSKPSRRPRRRVFPSAPTFREFEVPVVGIPIKRTTKEVSVRGFPFQRFVRILSTKGSPFRFVERELRLRGFPFSKVERLILFKGKRDLKKFLILLESLEEED